MRLISYAHTVDQFLDGTKDVTRRDAWENLRAGERLCAVKKAMGLKEGEKVERLGVIEVVSARREPLDAITDDDVRREGFPEWTAAGFVEFYTSTFGVPRDHVLTRIEFRKIAAPEGMTVEAFVEQLDAEARAAQREAARRVSAERRAAKRAAKRSADASEVHG